MKNYFLFVLVLIFAHHSFSMEDGVTVLFDGRFEDTRLPSFLWDKIKKANSINIGETPIKALIMDPNRKFFIYGNFIKSEELEDALKLSTNNFGFMLKSGDTKYDKLRENYHLEATIIDPTETSYLNQTFTLLSSEEPSEGLTLLGKGYITDPLSPVPSEAFSKSSAVREYYSTEGGVSHEQKRKVFWIIINSDDSKLNSIIELGQAYLRKVESQLDAIEPPQKFGHFI